MAYEYITNIVYNYEAAKKAMMEQIQSSMSVLFNDVFNDHPDLEVIQWKQYTDYFNDGDECTFYVREYSLSYKFKDDEDLLSDDDRYNTPEQDTIKKRMTDFEKAFFSVPSDVMKGAYGDHAEITVTRDGTTVEEYTSHD